MSSNVYLSTCSALIYYLIRASNQASLQIVIGFTQVNILLEGHIRSYFKNKAGNSLFVGMI
jgi:hypothetical protein